MARCPRQAHTAVSQLVEALLRDDRDRAWDLVLGRLLDTGSRLAVCADLLHPAHERLAELWYQSRIGVFDEGRAAETVASIVRALPPTPDPAALAGGGRCVLTAVRSERHTLGLEMLSRALEDDGWGVETVLGQDLPVLVERVRATRPRFVGVTAGHLERTAPMVALTHALSVLGVPVLVGGQAFRRSPELGRRLDVAGRASDLRVGLILARRLAGARPAFGVRAA
jgi:methanogenic corrinoid protein MtbC1